MQYMLILNLFQKAREERFPQHLRTVIKRLTDVALSNELLSGQHMSYQYQKFQLLLCASEISLQGGNIAGCINHTKDASALLLPDGYIFFAHLLLCRAYAAECNISKLQEEYLRCLQLKTDYPIGWICLKLMESQYELHADSNVLEFCIKESSEEGANSRNYRMAVCSLVMGLLSISNSDLHFAERCLARACSLAGADSCLLLCHGMYL